MSLFDAILNNMDGVAAKVGLQPDQVQALVTTIQGHLGNGTDQIASIEQAEQQHGIPVNTIQAVLAHADTSGGLAPLGSIAKGLFSQS